MSDTTPRQDDHPVDPTAPFEPATDAEHTEVVEHSDAEHTEVVPEPPAFEPSAAEPPAVEPPPAPVPAPLPVPPATQTFDPATQAIGQPAAGQQPFSQQYDQQQYAQQQAQYAQQQQYGQQPPPPPGAPGYALAPAPMKPTDERTAGMAAHGATLAATIFSSGFLGFVCALVMYLVFRDRGPFVRAHAANALNIQIIAGIVMLISLPLMLVLVGFLTFGAAVVWAIVMHIIGAVKANNGEWWSPPLTPQFVK
jgi:uncharacterized protein